VGAALIVWQSIALHAQGLPAGNGADLARSRCLVCHGADLIAQQRLSRDAWARELDRMIGWGAMLIASEKDTLGAYLAGVFGRTETAPRPSASIDDAGAALVRTRCNICHDNQLIEQQQLTLEGWSREVEKMVGWGANVNESEREPLVAHLASTSPAPILPR